MDARADNWSQTEPHDIATTDREPLDVATDREPLDIATTRDDDEDADHRRRSRWSGGVGEFTRIHAISRPINHSDRSV